MILVIVKMPGDLCQRTNIKQFLTGKTEFIPGISKTNLPKLFKDVKEESTYHCDLGSTLIKMPLSVFPGLLNSCLQSCRRNYGILVP